MYMYVCGVYLSLFRNTNLENSVCMTMEKLVISESMER